MSALDLSDAPPMRDMREWRARMYGVPQAGAPLFRIAPAPLPARAESDRAESDRAEFDRLRGENAMLRAQIAQANATVELQRTYPPVRRIIAVVAAHYGVSAEDIMSERRTANVVRPRQIAMYLSKALTLQTFPRIGRFFHRDHSTIVVSVQKIAALLDTDARLAVEIAEMRAVLAPASGAWA